MSVRRVHSCHVSLDLILVRLRQIRIGSIPMHDCVLVNVRPSGRRGNFWHALKIAFDMFCFYAITFNFNLSAFISRMERDECLLRSRKVPRIPALSDLDSSMDGESSHEGHPQGNGASHITSNGEEASTRLA